MTDDDLIATWIVSDPNGLVKLRLTHPYWNAATAIVSALSVADDHDPISVCAGEYEIPEDAVRACLALYRRIPEYFLGDRNALWAFGGDVAGVEEAIRVYRSRMDAVIARVYGASV